MSLSQYWRLVHEMARMSLKADAAKFYLSYLWWVLEPLLYVAVFYVVFDVLLGSKRADFLVFLMCGKLTFIWFSKSVVHSSRSIVASKGLIGKIDLPKSLFPLAMVQECFYKQIAVFALLLIFLMGNGYTANSSWFWLIPLILVNYLMIVAASFIAAFVVCIVFDLAVVISLSMMFLLFTSGIFWDVRSLPDQEMVDLVLLLNPVSFIVDGYRQILIEGTAPDLIHLLMIGVAATLVILAMVFLFRIFSRFLALKAITS